MSPITPARVAGGRRAPPVCPTCHRFLTAKLACWRCCERLCRLCGNPTGSAFIATCWPCSYREDAGRAGQDKFSPRRGRRPDRQGLLWPA
jgi:hypothetical protein